MYVYMLVLLGGMDEEALFVSASNRTSLFSPALRVAFGWRDVKQIMVQSFESLVSVGVELTLGYGIPSLSSKGLMGI